MVWNVEADIVRDEKGFPTSVFLKQGAKKASITFDPTRGFKLSGRLTADMKQAAALIYPAATETQLQIPQPLQVNQVQGGKTVFYDDMESLLKWTQTAATVALDNTVAYNGSQSLKITCAAGSANAYARRWFGARNKMSFETNFFCDSYANLHYLAFILAHDDGARTVDCRIHYDANNLVWQYLDDAGNFQDVQNSRKSAQYSPGANAWNFIKFEVDYINRRYGTLQINNQFFDLSRFNFRIQASGGVTQTYVGILVDNNVGLAVNAWFDDVLLQESDLT